MNITGVIWKLDPHVRYRRVLDEGVLIHQEKAEALVLNDTAVSFLELCNGSRNTGEIIDLLTARYQVEAEQLAADLQPFVAELVERGILESSGIPQE